MKCLALCTPSLLASNKAKSNFSADDVIVDELPVELNHTLPNDYLPAHPQSCYLCFKWSSVDGPTFVMNITNAYNEVMHWIRNTLKVSSGDAGKAFVHELAHLFKTYSWASKAKEHA